MHDNNKYKERYIKAYKRWERVSYVGWGIFVASVAMLVVVSFAVGSSWTNPFGLKNPESAPLCGIVLAFVVLGVAGWRMGRIKKIIEKRYVKKYEC